MGEHLLELHEEAFARHILIRKHVEFHLIMSSDIYQQLLILGFEECGRRDGYRLMPGRKHRPAVATSLRNKQPLARFQSLHYRQIIDAASGTIGKAESGSILLLLVIQIPVLNTDKPSFGIEVRNLQPVDALLIRPGSQSALVHHSPINLPLLEEKSSSRLVKPGMFEESRIPASIEGRFRRIITRGITTR